MTSLEKTIIIAIASFAVLMATQAAAAMTCMPRTTMLKMVTERLKETRQSHAIDAHQRRIEVFANPKTGRWTLIVTSLDGRSCVLAAGRGFEGNSGI